jgi:hypothetical protein
LDDFRLGSCRSRCRIVCGRPDTDDVGVHGIPPGCIRRIEPVKGISEARML